MQSQNGEPSITPLGAGAEHFRKQRFDRVYWFDLTAIASIFVEPGAAEQVGTHLLFRGPPPSYNSAVGKGTLADVPVRLSGTV